MSSKSSSKKDEIKEKKPKNVNGIGDNIIKDKVNEQNKTENKDEEVIKKESNTKKDINEDNDIDSSDDVTKKNLTKKDMLYADEQLILFDKIKKVLGIDKNGSFTTFDMDNNIKELMVLFKDVIKYHHSKVSISVKLDDPKCCLNVIRRVLKFHNFKIVGKNIGKDENGESKGIKYYVVKE